MSMFDNIVFDEFTLLEGEQADAYKRRKYNEKKEADRREKHYDRRRGITGGLTGDKNTLKNPNMKSSWTNEGKKADAKDKARRDEAREKSFDHALKNNTYDTSKIAHAMDATNRHLRKEEKKNKKQKVAESMIAAYESDYAY